MGKSKGVTIPEGRYYLGGEEEIRKMAQIAGRNLDNLKLLPKVILIGR